jgi:alginate O-acetyltransferase complex protein AlgI
VIPVFNSFDFFVDLIPLLIVVLPALALIKRGGLRRALLTATGMYLLFLIAPRLAILHFSLWLLVAVLQPLVASTGEKRGGLFVLFGSISIPIILVLLWKLFPVAFVVQMNVVGNRLFRPVSQWLTVVDLTANIVGPIGLSFAAFRAVDLLIKSNLGLVPRLSPGRVLAYGSFAPILMVGPIASYDEVSQTIETKVPLTRARAMNAALHVASGLVKIWVLAYPLAWSSEIFTVVTSDPQANSAARLWLSLFAYGWYFYFNFSGYSDVAIGIGQLMGGDIRENFDRPYFQTTPTAFWNSWHISLTRFLRANVFTPLTAGRTSRQPIATLITMLLIATWHRINLATVIFGLYHGFSLIGHRWVSARRPARTSTALRIGKSVAIFIWYVLSLPLIEMSFRDLGGFYRSLLMGSYR